ncbi:hypothetical protein EOA60_04520 [Mesorhizobium sp. M1A.F.Ca.IN.020.06.1.1]|uniref:hypothetical protein n=1 Tax=unclassified Mesorhizobium TaxID=325217 RepID=UPI000FC9F93E|nr:MULTISPECIES: hypothetical protein [unclassified Mesorhizobium]RUV07970.1 hypothetical protein EOA79_02455 [Mesorhizobium sp. M1A.F.Ca.IN.020.03.2.1]RUV17872.1 hypothetical protein EOA91_18695 [Mesorhizobium sp. M1A.F.Ca.IN.022.04.1.1]RUV84340.1 hypothetical protein EOA51_22220 [Mesorhizobium sp. M1A.F.Ca.IN.020.32.1.1]RUW13877.1 hypothetical protein EOA46_05280 [Mesorhizobium sp. M1A.F.Ca.IN.022.05.2.1]RUW35428.1 hypothetical protein EOA60_04520 [Mesorhizobium sp. M1A.F.Ca.IN.020.06.1.1]
MKTDGHGEMPKLTEPEPLPSLFVTGFAIQVVEENIVRLLLWTELPPLGGQEHQARLQARIAMPAKTFRNLVSEGRRVGRAKQ